MSVSVGPGWTRLTVMPRGPSSRASALVKPTIAALLVAYSAMPGPGTRSVTQLPIVITRPPSPRTPAAAWVAANTPRTFTASTRSTSSSAVSLKAPTKPTPALFTSTSSRPNSATVAETADDTAAASAESAWIASARRPRFLICSTTSAARAALCWYVSATSAPSSASRSAVAAPMPRLPPVTNATLPSRVIPGSPSIEPFSLTTQSNREHAKSTGGFPTARYRTMLTSRPGTTITLRGEPSPTIAATFSSASAAAWTSSCDAAAGTVTRERTLPLTWIGYSTESSTRYFSSTTGNGPCTSEST